MLENYENAQNALGWIDSYADAALLCINDDVAIDDEKVAAGFQQWAGEHWGTPAAWER